MGNGQVAYGGHTNGATQLASSDATIDEMSKEELERRFEQIVVRFPFVTRLAYVAFIDGCKHPPHALHLILLVQCMHTKVGTCTHARTQYT